MADKIFLISENDTLTSLMEEAYINEDLLQSLLAKYPDLLPGDQINEQDPRRWLLISREMGVPGENGANRLSLDHLYVDQDSIPTLVEVKRSTDTRIRREVVGQMLDYAANAVAYLSIERLRERFESACDRDEKDASQLILDLLQLTPSDVAAVEVFWEAVKVNLKTGRIRLLFVADQIPVELKRVIEFLNTQMPNVEVLGVEIRQFTGDNIRTLVPRICGQTAQTSDKNTIQRTQNQWDEPKFLTALSERKGAQATNTAKDILNWSQQSAYRIWWGCGMRDGSMVPVFKILDLDHYFFVVWTNAVVEMQFQHMLKRPGFNQETARLQMIEKLNCIPGISLPASSHSGRPSFPLAALYDLQARATFYEIMNWGRDLVSASGIV